MDKVQKIREEVERLKSKLLRGACSSQIAMETRCKEEAYNEVLAIINSEQREPIGDNYQPWLLVMACHIMKEAFAECQEKGTIPYNIGLEHPIDAIENHLMSKVSRGLRIKPLKQCSIEELEEELKKRKEVL